jgi:hypothetical protein
MNNINHQHLKELKMQIQDEDSVLAILDLRNLISLNISHSALSNQSILLIVNYFVNLKSLNIDHTYSEEGEVFEYNYISQMANLTSFKFLKSALIYLESFFK